jgi:hypothetical protein
MTEPVLVAPPDAIIEMTSFRRPDARLAGPGTSVQLFLYITKPCLINLLHLGFDVPGVGVDDSSTLPAGLYSGSTPF